MIRSNGGLAVLALLALAVGVCLWPQRHGYAAAEEPPAPKKDSANEADPALAGSAINAVVNANGGKAPATGKELWEALNRLGKFAQLPVVFSQVRLDSGVSNPRVVITPVATGLSEAAATEPSLTGRLFLAANMERNPDGGDPRVTSVEFISWNALRRKFDFGVIEGMGGDGTPELKVVDGGRCFSCHKNKGPILSATPWTNSTHHIGLRTLVGGRLNVFDSVPPGPAGAGKRDRIDGMALVAPEGDAVDGAVRLGAIVRVNRERFRLMNRSDPGRKGFVAMLVVIAQPGPLTPFDRQTRIVVDQWANHPSYLQFTNDWKSLARETHYGVLIDFAPIPKPLYHSWGMRSPAVRGVRIPQGKYATAAKVAEAYEAQVKQIQQAQQQAAQRFANELTQLATSDAARAAGAVRIPSVAQPSNPKAFIPQVPKVTQNPSGMVNPLMLATTIGLTEGDRKFMAEALADAARKLARQKVTAAALARQVFEGPEFADVLAGGPLPDRDDFKDRFVAGLHGVLTTKYKLSDGFAPERRLYASGPRRDPKTLDKLEAAVVPTSACLRCHDVRATPKDRLFEPIPALAFDPLDKQGRADWVRAAAPKRKLEVLARLSQRLFDDSDMPPEDAPEHDLFRVKQSAAFDDLKQFLAAELDKLEPDKDDKDGKPAKPAKP